MITIKPQSIAPRERVVLLQEVIILELQLEVASRLCDDLAAALKKVQAENAALKERLASADAHVNALEKSALSLRRAIRKPVLPEER